MRQFLVALNASFTSIIERGLARLARSRWLGIDQIRKNLTRLISSHLDRANFVNNRFIIIYYMESERHFLVGHSR